MSSTFKIIYSDELKNMTANTRIKTHSALIEHYYGSTLPTLYTLQGVLDDVFVGWSDDVIITQFESNGHKDGTTHIKIHVAFKKDGRGLLSRFFKDVSWYLKKTFIYDRALSAHVSAKLGGATPVEVEEVTSVIEGVNFDNFSIVYYSKTKSDKYELAVKGSKVE